MKNHSIFAAFAVGLVALMAIGCKTDGETEYVTVNDTTPPAKVTVAEDSVAASDGKVILAWTNPADSDFYGTKITFVPVAENVTQPVVIEGINSSKSYAVVNGLANGTEYTFSLFSLDKSHNLSEAVIVKGTPMPSTDTTPPAEVAEISAESHDRAVSLVWKDPADEDLFGIEITYTTGDAARSVSAMEKGSIFVAPGTQQAHITNLTNGTEYTFSVKTMDTSGNKSTAVTVKATPNLNIDDYLPGKTVFVDNTEYLVTANFYLPEEESENNYGEKYSSTYLQDRKVKVRRKYIEEVLGFTQYIELYRTFREEKTTSGTANMCDYFTLFDKNLKQIGKANQRWNSDVIFSSLYGVTDKAKQTEMFNALTEAELRQYDPNNISLSDFPKTKECDIRFEYYDDSGDENSEHYKRINYDAISTKTEGFDFVDEKATWKIEEKNTGTISYYLCHSGYSFASLAVYDENKVGHNNLRFLLMARGDGLMGGSTDSSIHKNAVTSWYFKSQPVYVEKRIGAVQTEKLYIKSVTTGEGSYASDYSGSVSIVKQTSSNGTSWTTDPEEKVAVSEIGSKTDCMSVSTETTVVKVNDRGVTVPASIKYTAHFAKNTDGYYPVLDRYMSVTCYPVYDAETDRIYYGVTEKSLEDFVQKYVTEFEKLKSGTLDIMLPNEEIPETDTTPKFVFSGDSLKIELEEMSTNFEIQDDANASGGKAGLLVDENSYAEAIITFPAGTYTGYVCEYAPSALNDGFYVKLGGQYVRIYGSDPLPGAYELTERTPITLTASEESTVRLRILKDCPTKSGESGMLVDYVIFKKTES